MTRSRWNLKQRVDKIEDETDRSAEDTRIYEAWGLPPDASPGDLWAAGLKGEPEKPELLEDEPDRSKLAEVWNGEIE